MAKSKESSTGHWTEKVPVEVKPPPVNTIEFFKSIKDLSVEQLDLVLKYGKWERIPVGAKGRYWCGIDGSQFVMTMRDGVAYSIDHYIFKTIGHFKYERGLGWQLNAQRFVLGVKGVPADPTRALLFILKRLM